MFEKPTQPKRRDTFFSANETKKLRNQPVRSKARATQKILKIHGENNTPFQVFYIALIQHKHQQSPYNTLWPSY